MVALQGKRSVLLTPQPQVQALVLHPLTCLMLPLCCVYVLQGKRSVPLMPQPQAH
jgi:hypothetical protein